MKCVIVVVWRCPLTNWYDAACSLYRLREDEGGVPSTVAETHRKELQGMDEVIRKEQQVCSSTNTPTHGEDSFDQQHHSSNVVWVVVSDT